MKKSILSILFVVVVLSVVGIVSGNQVVWKTQTPQPGVEPATTSVVQVTRPSMKTGGGVVIRNLQGITPNSTIPIIVPIQTATTVPVIPPVLWQPTQIPNAAPYVPPVVTAPTLAPRLPYDCSVNVNRPYFYEQFSPGQDFDFDVTFTNTGTQPWNTDIDVMQYTGWKMEIEHKYLYDIDKDYSSAQIVLPGQSIRWKIRMEAPKEKTSDNDKYFSTYNLVRGRDVENGRFCPFSLYVYVPR